MKKIVMELTGAFLLASVLLAVMLGNVYYKKSFNQEKTVEKTNKDFNSQVLPKMGQE